MPAAAGPRGLFPPAWQGAREQAAVGGASRGTTGGQWAQRSELIAQQRHGRDAIGALQYEFMEQLDSVRGGGHSAGFPLLDRTGFDPEPLGERAADHAERFADEPEGLGRAIPGAGEASGHLQLEVVQLGAAQPASTAACALMAEQHGGKRAGSDPAAVLAGDLDYLSMAGGAGHPQQVGCLESAEGAAVR